MDKIIEIAGIYYNNALKHIKENNISKAVDCLKRSIKLYSKDIDVLNLMGICRYMLCEFDKAYFYWNKSIKFNNKENKAIEYLKIIKSRKFSGILKTYNKALEELKCSNYKEAIENLQSVISEEKNFLEPYIIMSLCYYMLGKYNIAKRYIEIALKIDKENKKGLLYLKEINDKTKGKSNKGILAFLIIALTGVLYKSHNNYIIVKNNLQQYQQRYNKNTIELKLIKDKYHRLSNEIESSNKKIKSKFINKNDNEIFNSAILHYTSKNYTLALEEFTYICESGINEDLVAESTYFLAVCYERAKYLNRAEEFYCRYIQKYKNKNYYDDALYNYGIMLYRQGRKEKAKQILFLLKEQVPESIFINKTLKIILDN